jgi:hypothetical protein
MSLIQSTRAPQRTNAARPPGVGDAPQLDNLCYRDWLPKIAQCISALRNTVNTDQRVPAPTSCHQYGNSHVVWETAVNLSGCLLDRNLTSTFVTRRGQKRTAGRGLKLIRVEIAYVTVDWVEFSLLIIWSKEGLMKCWSYVFGFDDTISVSESTWLVS